MSYFFLHFIMWWLRWSKLGAECRWRCSANSSESSPWASVDGAAWFLKPEESAIKKKNMKNYLCLYTVYIYVKIKLCVQASLLKTKKKHIYTHKGTKQKLSKKKKFLNYPSVLFKLIFNWKTKIRNVSDLNNMNFCFYFPYIFIYKCAQKCLK